MAVKSFPQQRCEGHLHAYYEPLWADRTTLEHQKSPLVSPLTRLQAGIFNEDYVMLRQYRRQRKPTQGKEMEVISLQREEGRQHRMA